MADCSVRFARSLTLSPSRIVIVSFGSSCAPCNRCSKRTDTFTKAQLNLFHVGASIWFFFFSFSTSFPFLISDCCISLLHNLYVCVCVYIFLMNLTMDLCWLMAPNCGCIFITNVANWFTHSTGLHNLLPIRAFHLSFKWEEELLLGFSFELKIAIEKINQLRNR